MAALAGSNAELHQASSRINTTISQFFAGCHSDERCSSDARKAWRRFNAKLKKDLNALTSLPYPSDPNCIPRFLENTVRNLLQYRPSAHRSMTRNELEVSWNYLLEPVLLTIGMLNRNAQYVAGYYRDLLVDVVRIFIDIPFLGYSQEEDSQSETLAEIKNKCIRALSPLTIQLSEKKLYDSLPVISLVTDNIRTALPFIARVRLTIRTTPTTKTTRSTAFLTATCIAGMIEYLHSQYDRGNLPILEFYEIAQVSSEEVVQSCLVGLDDVCELQGCLSQLRAIEIIIAYARTPSLQIAVGRGRFITRTARLMRSFRLTSRNDSVSRWPDLTLALWCALLCDNSRIMDETLAIEAVDANIMSLVEWRSWFGDEYVLFCTRDLVQAILVVLSLVPASEGLRLRAFRQLETTYLRMRHPSIKPEVAAVWEEVYSFWSTLVLVDDEEKRGPPCAAIGCDSEGPATMCCARCLVTYYCSETCQRPDWKVHKLHCR